MQGLRTEIISARTERREATLARPVAADLAKRKDDDSMSMGCLHGITSPTYGQVRHISILLDWRG